MPRTHRIKVYKFAELSAAAKEKAREWYREMVDHDFDPDDFKERLTEPAAYHHRVKTEHCHYSLSYCQGDGVAFYGDFDLDFFMTQPGEEGAPPDGGELAAERAAIQAQAAALLAAGFELAVEIDGRHGHYHHYNSMSVKVTTSAGPDEDDRWNVTRSTLLRWFGPEPAEPMVVAMLASINDPDSVEETPCLVGFDWLDDQGYDTADLRRAFVPNDVWAGKVIDLENALDEYMEAVSHAIEKIGYEELEYQRSDEVVDENIELNDYEFTADGERFSPPRRKKKRRPS